MAKKERIQKVIARSGTVSRREAEKLLLAGEVQVNGKVITELGTKVDPEKDSIKVRGKLLKKKPPLLYLIFHKPPKIMTTKKDPEGRPTVYDYFKKGKNLLNTVGRLDYYTEGLLLFTNDGDLHHKLLHPSFEVEKEYMVLIKGKLSQEDINKVGRGAKLEDGFTKPKKVIYMNSFNMGNKNKATWIKLTITIGKNRVIRRLMESMDYEIIRLVRSGFAGIYLDDLKMGKSRYLTDEEIKDLKAVIKN